MPCLPAPHRAVPPWSPRSVSGRPSGESGTGRHSRYRAGAVRHRCWRGCACGTVPGRSGPAHRFATGQRRQDPGVLARRSRSHRRGYPSCRPRMLSDRPAVPPVQPEGRGFSPRPAASSFRRAPMRGSGPAGSPAWSSGGGSSRSPPSWSPGPSRYRCPGGAPCGRRTAPCAAASPSRPHLRGAIR